MTLVESKGVDFYQLISPITDLIGWQLPKTAAGPSRTFRELVDTWIEYFAFVDNTAVISFIVTTIEADTDVNDVFAYLESPEFRDLVIFLQQQVPIQEVRTS